ncbi:MAG: phage/plasmid primase, P4 family [bacterium]
MTKEFTSSKVTEMQIKTEIVDLFKTKIKYVCALRKWIVYNGTKWDFDEDGKVLKEIISFISEKTANSENSPYLKFTAYNKILKIIELMKPFLAVNLCDLNKDDNLFNCKNRTIKLDAKKSTKHNRDYLITKVSNVEIIKNSTCAEIIKKSSCDEWLKFLNIITSSNQELIDYLQRVIGYCLSGYANEQCFFILYGNGMNGKTVFVETLRYVFGDYACSAPRSFILNEKEHNLNNDILNFLTSRLAILSEVEENSCINAKTIKIMSGNDTFAVNVGNETLEFKNKSKIFIITNTKPEIKESTDAIWRRVQIIPFVAEISEADRDIFLFEKLKNEGAGILKWALEGYQKWRDDGSLNPPEIIRSETTAYKEQMDNVFKFIEEKCIKDQEESISTTQLHECYTEFCRENGYKTLTQIRFVESLKAKGYEKIRIGNKRAVSGLFIKGARREAY